MTKEYRKWEDCCCTCGCEQCARYTPVWLIPLEDFIWKDNTTGKFIKELP